MEFEDVVREHGRALVRVAYLLSLAARAPATLRTHPDPGDHAVVPVDPAEETFR